MRKAIIIGLALFVGGCSTIKDIAIPIIADTKPPLHLQDPTPISIDNVHWNVVTAKNSAAILKQLETAGQPPAVVGLSTSDFQSLTIDLGKLNQYVDSLKKELDSYKKYYEPIDPSKPK